MDVSGFPDFEDLDKLQRRFQKYCKSCKRRFQKYDLEDLEGTRISTRKILSETAGDAEPIELFNPDG